MRDQKQAKVAQSVEEYLLNFPEEVQVVLEQVRLVIRETAPQAQEVISYQIPGYKYLGPVVYFAAYKKHCSLFVIDKNILKLFAEELREYKTAGTTIHFTPDKPLPSLLIQKIVHMRVQENETLDLLKKQKALHKKLKLSTPD